MRRIRPRHLVAALALAVAAPLALAGSAAMSFADTAEPQPEGDTADRVPVSRYVFVARADDPVDALAVGAVAGTLGGDVLLTAGDGLSPAARARLSGVGGATVVLVGGQNAVGTAVADEIGAMGFDVQRVAGATRIETAAELGVFAERAGHGRPVLTEGPVAGDPVVLGTLTADRFVTAQDATLDPTPEPDPSAGTTTPIPGEVASDQDGSVVSDTLFPWLDVGGTAADQWLWGLLLFGLGLVGALVAVYAFLGESLPSSGGQVEIRKARQRIEQLETEYDQQMAKRRQLLGADPLDSPRIDHLATYCAELGDVIEKDKQWVRRRQWQLYRSGLPLYLVLGGLTAVLFASSLLQAIIFGFGWTAVVDRIGLRRETEEVAREKNEALGDLQGTIHDLEEEVGRAAGLQARNQELEQAVDQLSTLLVEQVSGHQDGG
jgi:hypothetical protein